MPLANSDSRSSGEKVLRVAELNRAVGQLLSSSFPMVWVAGEISNFTRAASGHCYFSLKDVSAQVRAVMFRSRLRAVPFEPRNGQQVQALATVSLYEARGDFQLNVENLRLAGAGDLHQQFLELKARLQQEGLFDIASKKAIPAVPRAIAVVTSLQAAALRDVLITLRQRAPQVPVRVYPAPVQGADAPSLLVRALQAASQRAQSDQTDVLLLVRGGGSIEDLWAFNNEHLARAIRACAIPVVVGVGHESDVTIADFAADLRAPTPTGAAAAAIPARDELLRRIDQAAHQLAGTWRRRVAQLEQRLDMVWRLLPTPARQYQAQIARLNSAQRNLGLQFTHGQQVRAARLQLATQRLRPPALGLQQARLSHQSQRLRAAMHRVMQRSSERLAGADTQLGLVSPQAVLERGYSVLRDENGRVLASTGAVKVGDHLGLLMADGTVQVTADKVNRSK